MIHVKKTMNLENMLSETSHTQQDKCHMILLI